ncbi:MAG: hypothetical protein J0I32_09145 [Sphingobacteriales bacterium]|nr:hypothetical protein [Sphingobacteriales bacterium]OJW00163.1 MAG: hypothetical protein BGO52_03490 [Sphingobacteriales bacterium 44-61]
MNLPCKDELIRDKVEYLFGDEGLRFQSARLTKLIEAAYVNEFPASQSAILHLLYTQNEILDLIDIGQLIYENTPTVSSNESSKHIIKQAKFLCKRIGNWDDFPSHLHPHEWTCPLVVVQAFFAKHSVYEWRTLVQCLFESALGTMSINESAESFWVGLDIIELYRLLDAVWVYKMIEGIEMPIDMAH